MRITITTAMAARNRDTVRMNTGMTLGLRAPMGNGITTMSGMMVAIAGVAAGGAEVVVVVATLRKSYATSGRKDSECSLTTVAGFCLTIGITAAALEKHVTSGTILHLQVCNRGNVDRSAFGALDTACSASSFPVFTQFVSRHCPFCNRLLHRMFLCFIILDYSTIDHSNAPFESRKMRMFIPECQTLLRTANQPSTIYASCSLCMCSGIYILLHARWWPPNSGK